MPKSTEEIQAKLIELSQFVGNSLNLIYGKTSGFCLLSTPFGEGNLSQCVGNMDRKSLIKILRDTANTLEFLDNEEETKPCQKLH